MRRLHLYARSAHDQEKLTTTHSQIRASSPPTPHIKYAPAHKPADPSKHLHRSFFCSIRNGAHMTYVTIDIYILEHTRKTQFFDRGLQLTICNERGLYSLPDSVQARPSVYWYVRAAGSSSDLEKTTDNAANVAVEQTNGSDNQPARPGHPRENQTTANRRHSIKRKPAHTGSQRKEEHKARPWKVL